MNSLPPILNKVIESFKKFPGIGGKTAHRLGLHALKSNAKEIEEFAQSLLDLNVSAQNRLWNRYRDEAEWFVNITEAREARAHQAALTAQQNNFSMDMYNDKAKDSFWMTIGGAIFDVIQNP